MDKQTQNSFTFINKEDENIISSSTFIATNVTSTPNTSNYNEISLDSEIMDASVVLFGSHQVKIPFPNAKVFNNLAEYYSKTLAKKKNEAEQNVEEKQDISMRLMNTPGSSRFADFKFKRDNNIIQSKKPKKIITNVIEKMTNATGPLSILYRSISKQINILVRRRKMSTLREERFSWITGQLIAFDRHINLALTNVIEQYRYKSNNSTVTKGVLIRKFSRQLFVRGDNIVLVTI